MGEHEREGQRGGGAQEKKYKRNEGISEENK